MTPTLQGRWQTRFYLLSTLGVLISLLFGALYEDYQTPLVLLVYVFLIGSLWDILYNYLQTLRWDRDWPPIFFVFNIIIEGLLLWLIIKFSGLWEVFDRQSPFGVGQGLTFGKFFFHYSTVSIITVLFMLGPMKIVLLRWRFNGGEWL